MAKVDLLHCKSSLDAHLGWCYEANVIQWLKQYMKQATLPSIQHVSKDRKKYEITELIAFELQLYSALKKQEELQPLGKLKKKGFVAATSLS